MKNFLPGCVRVILTALLLVATLLVVGHQRGISAAQAAGGAWISQNSGTTNVLSGISCPTATTCFIAGGNGTILSTTTGGATWTPQTSGTTTNLLAISCPTATTCFAVGGLTNGTIRATTNGGTTWTGQTSGTTNVLLAISCPTATICFAVGYSGTIRATTNGGATWSAQTSGTSTTLSGISCPTATTCFAGGNNSIILATTNGGATWTTSHSAGNALPGILSISCPTTSVCFAGTDLGTILSTTTGGATWITQSPAATNSNILYGFSCPTTSACFAVGQFGIIVVTTDGGATWTSQPSGTSQYFQGISCPAASACFVVGYQGTILTNTNTPGNPLTTLSHTWYFAEGFSGPNFNTYYTVFNPTAVTANLTVTYFLSTGATTVVPYTVQPAQPRTWFANADLPPNSAFGARIASDQPVMAERAMYFQIAAINGNPPATGASDVVGVPAPNTQWYFAEGYTGPGFNEFLTLMNPDPALTAAVSVQYFTQAGVQPTKFLNILPGRRFTITVNDPVNLGVGPNQAVGASISSTVPIVAERPMYFSFSNLNRGPGGPATILGGHDVMGANTLGTTFNFAEGYTGPDFSEYLTLTNPGTANTTATITYYVQGGSPVTRTLAVPAGTRQTVSVWAPPSASNPAGLGQANVGVSVNVTTNGAGNGVPILVERPIYFAIQNFNGQLETLTGGTIAIGSNALGTTVVFATGTTQTNYNEFITIENPNSAPANITVTYYVAGGGGPQTRSLQVPANTRGTILVFQVANVFPSNNPAGLGPNVDPLVTGGGATFPGGVSTVLTSDQPILAERPEYMLATNVNVGAGGPAQLPGGHDAVGVVM